MAVLTAIPTLLTAQPPARLAKIALLAAIHLLGGDLAFANAAQTKIEAPGLASFISATPFGYPADPKTFPPAIWKQLAYIQLGVSREELAKHLQMNGGVVDDRYVVTLDGPPGEVPRALLVHIIFRPAAMDEATFQDEKKRAHWHQEHPESQPFDRADVVVTFDKPYWGSYCWD